MLWKELLDKEYCSTVVILQESVLEREYYSAVPVSEFTREFRADVLYFCSAEQFRRLRHAGEASVLVLGDVLSSELALMGGQGNIAVFDNAEAFSACFDGLVTEFSIMRRLDERLQQLAALVANDAGLDVIANHIAESFGHFVTIVDNSQTILAHSTNYPIPVRDIVEDIRRGYIPADIMQKVKRNQPRLREKTNPTPFLVPHLYGQFKHYMTPVIIGPVTAGFFSVYYTPQEQPPSAEFPYLQKTAELLSIKMQRVDFHRTNKSNFYTRLFSKLLSGDASPGDNWPERFGAYGYTLKENMFVLVVELQKEKLSNVVIDNLGKNVANYFANGIYFVQDNLILVFCSFSDDRPLTEAIMADWEEFSRINDLKVGVSSRFTDPSDIRPYVDEAKAAILTGEIYSPQNHFFRYDDYRLAHIASILNQYEHAKSFAYPPLVKLLEHDDARHTQLSYTLYQYYLHMKEPAEAYKALFIHKNTFYYRLKEIRAIMGVNIDAFEVIAQVTLSLLMVASRKKLPFTIVPVEEKRRSEI